jgi:hypothetical protein
MVIRENVMLLYAIDATVVHHTAKGDLTHQVPTFYLNSGVQGIQNADHAKKIASDVICPIKSDDISINVTAVPFQCMR